ncbi:MAG: MATE family efflux transporter [Rhodoferax sp.]|nr:MATE family efflux transporter [Rhodoferax sp.]
MFRLAWPLMAELGLALLLGGVGTAWAARISDAAGGGFALAMQVSAALFLLFRILGAGVGVVVTQALGAGERATADRVTLAVLGASSWTGAATAVLAVLFAWPLLRMLQAPPEVLALAAPFLQALAPALMLDAWNATMASVMRAHLRTRDTLWVLLAMHASHLALAWPLMQGWGPVPALGLAGFAIALAISRALGLVLHLWLWRRTLNLHPQRSDWWRLPRRELTAVLHIGVPGAAETVLHRLCFMVTLAAAAQLGATALATHAYVQQLQGGIWMFSLALGFTAEIMVGHHIGAGQFHAAQSLVSRALLQGLGLTLAVSVAGALAAPALLGWFTQDSDILSMGQTLMWLTVLVETGRTFNLVLVNALRGAGDARYPLRAGWMSMPLVLAGGGWLLGITLGWGLPGLWLAYAADEWLRGLLMWRRWATQAWVPQARQARRRLLTNNPSTQPMT